MTRRAALVALTAVQLTGGVRAVGTLLASSLFARAEGTIASIACGTLAYIAVVDLAPELIRTRQRAAILPFVLGAAIVVGVS